MTIDWHQVGQMALMVLTCLGALVVLILLAVLNDLWLKWVMTPDEYQRMIDSYDEYWP